MWFTSSLKCFAAGCNHVRREHARARSLRGRPARALSVERLEDRLAPAAGALDSTFGTGGVVTTDFDSSNDGGTAMAIQADGKIVVAGVTDTGGSGRNFAVARYLADGTLDPTFSPGPLLGQGKVATDIAGGDDVARSVAIQADGKIVVAGVAVVSGSFDFAVVRYNPDGILDDSFGRNGKVTTDFAGGSDDAFGVAIQADGKIVVAGRAGFPLGPSGVAGSAFGLARYNPNGTPDTGFGTGGKATAVFAGGDEAHSVVIQADGKIVAAGIANLGPGFDFVPDFALARYNANGTPDANFGTGGKVSTDFNGGVDEAHSVAIQADGRIVVAGDTAIHGFSGFRDFGLARYNRDGSLDSNFDADGKVITDLGGSDIANSVVLRGGDSRIVVAGSTSDFFTGFALARYNFDGSLYADFGARGTVITDVGGGGAAGAAIQADGKIVAAGSVGGFRDFALARYVGLAPEIAVFLGGVGLASDATVDYGTTPVGTAVTKILIIRNVGELNLMASVSVPAGYETSTLNVFGFTLAPGAQAKLAVQLAADTAGIFNGRVSISTNDDDENPFVINVTGTVLAPAHEIQVLNRTTDIPDNTGVVNFGTFTFGSTKNVTRTFTVQNIGNTNLTLGPGITVPFGFSQASAFGSTTLGPGASTTFALSLNTNILGALSGQVSFITNDSDENPFNFTVTGAVGSAIALPMIRGESLTRHVDEGGVATLRGHLVDADPLDELFLRVDWADGTPPETHAVGRAPFALQHRYVDDAPSGTAADDYQVHFTWFDSGGGSNSKTFPVTVANVAPQVSVGLPAHLRSDEALTRVGSFTDPGLDSWYATVDYGDGRGPQWLALGADNSFTLSHVYTRPWDYHLRVRVFDDDGGVGTATLNVTVRNAPPQLFLGGTEAVRAGEVMRHAGHFIDPDSKTWRATVDYGDGSGPQPLAIRPGQQLSFEHRYATPGEYRVTVTVLDDDGGLATDSIVVTVLPPL